MTIKVLVVGRHTGEIPDVEVIGQENVSFALNRSECTEQIISLANKAIVAGADGILFQNTPGIVAVSLGWLHGTFADEFVSLEKSLHVKVGVIISKPGPRLSGISQEFQMTEENDARNLVAAVQFANGRAKVEERGPSVKVTVDPVAAFEFDHIEWM